MATPEAAGTFFQYPLPKLLFYLYRKQYTGSLVVKRSATIYLRDGIPVCGETGDAPRNLTLEEVALARKHDLLEQLTELFWLADAEFAVYREGHPYGATPEEARQLRLHPRRVIYHGIRAAYDVARVKREVGTALDGQMVRIGTEATTSLGRYRFTADDQMLVTKLTAGFWTPTNLIAETGALDVDAWRLIYALWVTGMLDLRPRDAASPLPQQPRPMAQPVRPEDSPGTYRFSKKTLPPHVREERIDLPDSIQQATQRPASETDRVRSKIEATARSLMQMRDHELLAITPDASREQIKAAYVAQKRTFDPERLTQLKLEPLRDAAARICGAIEAAYARVIRPFVDAEREVEWGLEALKDQHFALAEQFFRRALELRPDDTGAREGLRLAQTRKPTAAQ